MGNMKAFTTACALIAGVSAETNLGLSFGAEAFFPSYYHHRVIHHPVTQYVPYGIHPAYSGVHYLRKREAEPSFTYQTKVTHPDEKAAYEYRVNVDRLGNGHSSASSYQFHEQQRDNMMRQQQRQNQMFGRMDQLNGQRVQYGMDNRMGGRMAFQDGQEGPNARMHLDNQMMRQRDNQMTAGRDNQRNTFDRMIEQRQDSNLRDQYLRRQDGRMSNFYSYERMLQRQNEARRNMNNQHRMFKREAEPSFEYEVTAERENNNRQMVSRNQQMMDVMIRPEQQTYRNQINNQRMQYNRMDGRMNQKEQMMQQRNQYMNQFNNQMDQRNRYNMDNRMDSHRNQMDTHMNRMDTHMNQMQGRNNQRMQYNRNNQMTNQMHQRQFDDFFPGTFGLNRDSMQFQNNQFQQDQFRNYY